MKALESGLLLVSGPYKVNGVPIRRVNQAYVIATKSKIDVSKVDVSKFTDEYFARKQDNTKEGEEEFFKGDAPKPAIVSDERKADQKTVDTALTKAVDSVSMMKEYLGARFSLSHSDKPHNMVFLIKYLKTISFPDMYSLFLWLSINSLAFVGKF